MLVSDDFHYEQKHTCAASEHRSSFKENRKNKEFSTYNQEPEFWNT